MFYSLRLSLQAFKNISEQEAEKIALREGEELMRFLIHTTKQFRGVKISSWKESIDKNYYKLLSEVKVLEKKNKEFSRLVEGEFTETVVSKLRKNIKKRELSKNFIMEEIAMFASLVLRGFSTRISKYSRSKSIDFFLKGKNKNLDHIQIR